MSFYTVRRSRITGLALRALQASAMAFATPALSATVHLAQDGDDGRDGTSASQAVATLRRAVDLALSDGREATVIIAPGVYRDQKISLDAGRITVPLSIRGGSTDPRTYPAFVGLGTDTFLRWRGPRLGGGRLSVRNLRIARYETAISLEGNRDAPEAANGGAILADNIFAQIGTSAKDKPTASTAALRMVNSRDNLVARNYFHGIRNAEPRRCPQLHPVYLAHFSSGNRIVGNTFQDYCGSAIKLRDRANENTIADNRFIDGGSAPAIEEWFCDKAAASDCTKASGECPSTANIVGANRFERISFFRRLAIRGGRKMRPWCNSNDFSAARVSVKERLDPKPLLSGLDD